MTSHFFVQPNVYINTVVEPVDSFCFNMNYFNGIVHIILCILILILWHHLKFCFPLSTFIIYQMLHMPCGVWGRWQNANTALSSWISQNMCWQMAKGDSQVYGKFYERASLSKIIMNKAQFYIQLMMYPVELVLSEPTNRWCPEPTNCLLVYSYAGCVPFAAEISADPVHYQQRTKLYTTGSSLEDP